MGAPSFFRLNSAEWSAEDLLGAAEARASVGDCSVGARDDGQHRSRQELPQGGAPVYDS